MRTLGADRFAVRLQLCRTQKQNICRYFTHNCFHTLARWELLTIKGIPVVVHNGFSIDVELEIGESLHQTLLQSDGGLGA